MKKRSRRFASNAYHPIRVYCWQVVWCTIHKIFFLCQEWQLKFVIFGWQAKFVILQAMSIQLSWRPGLRPVPILSCNLTFPGYTLYNNNEFPIKGVDEYLFRIINIRPLQFLIVRESSQPISDTLVAQSPALCACCLLLILVLACTGLCRSIRIDFEALHVVSFEKLNHAQHYQ